jgi:high-affinity iron transporter
MLQAFVITFREGLEAFLIVAISLSYLRKTGRQHLVPPVYWAVGFSIVTSAAAGYLFSLASNQALWEGSLATFAALFVGTLVVQMWRAARTLKRNIQERLGSVAGASTQRMAWLGIFLFVVLMITREGMETALLLGTLMFQVKAPPMIAGAFAGIVAAAGIAVLWSRFGHRINLPRFLQVTAVFLFVFVVQLLIYGVHELSEANVLPNSLQIHDATEPYGPDGIYGSWLSLALIAIPLAWLLISAINDRMRRRKAPAQPIADCRLRIAD